MPDGDKKQIPKDDKMSQFARKKSKPQKTYEKPWENPEHDILRSDKKALSKEFTEEERFIMTCQTARNMEKRFGRKPWMDKFINRNGKNLPYQKGITT